MPRVFKFELSQSKPCPRCGVETSKLFVLSESSTKAIKNLSKGYFLCGECLAEILAEKRFLVRTPHRIKFREFLNKV